MITRFDHAVIAVRELDAAMRHYRDLGFDVRAGGRHTGLGTYNAIIRFGLDYLELLSVYDEAEANASGPGGQVLVDVLRERAGGLVGYALATSDIEDDAARLRDAGLPAVGPFAMERLRPDGRLLSWRLLVPGGVPWRRPWPFLIQWDAPDEQRLAWEQPGEHPNGARSVAGIALAVHDIESAIELYERHLRLPRHQHDDVSTSGARRASFVVGGFRIDLLTPLADAPVGQARAPVEAGPVELVLTVEDLEQARTVLAKRGATVEPVAGAPATIRIPVDRALGAQLVLTGRPAAEAPS